MHFFKFKDTGIISMRYKSGTWEIIGDVMGVEKKRLKSFEDYLDLTGEQ